MDRQTGYISAVVSVGLELYFFTASDYAIAHIFYWQNQVLTGFKSYDNHFLQSFSYIKGLVSQVAKCLCIA